MRYNMVVALKLCLIILSCTVFVQADVSHVANSRYRGQRVRLQRLESAPTPYPAAGYRPNREFGLPGDQPLFPLGNQNSNRPQVSSGFDNLSEPQKPQLLYGSPDQEPRYRPQSRPQSRPQNFNGFNNLAEPDQREFVVQYQPANANRQPQNSNSGFNNFAEPQQPEFVEQVQQPQPQNNNNGFDNDFNNFGEAQQSPELLYGAPNTQEQEVQSARLKQQLLARLQQAQRLEQLQQQAGSQRYRKSQSQQQRQQFFNSPQTLYSAPFQQQRQLQAQAQAESQTSRFVIQKPARLTDNREETEPESDARASETVEDIETTTKAESKKTVTQTVATTAPAVANTGLVSYYPATAFGFVQPVNGAYLASANYQTVQPFSPAAYTVGSPFLPQQYAVAGAAPAQLQAW